ncbi:MAG TPA: N-acetylgalactosamine-6-sulfatase [Phycisphaerales bacterium]|nr:N-acetylgalactosamine-6-sulfatase [Phycisphaerales bacterium]
MKLLYFSSEKLFIYYDSPMHNITYLFIGFSQCIVVSTFAVNKTSHSVNKPNIVFILADDLGYGEVGCFGQKLIKTPNIDQLSVEGMKLTEHYSGSPVCASSRCTLLTGKHTGEAIIRNNRELGGWGPEEPEGQFPLPANTPTISSTLKSNGYVTGAFGKWGLGGPDTTGLPNDQGFDYFYGYLCQRVAHNYYPTHLWKNKNKEMLKGNEVWFSAHQKLNEALSFEQYSAETYAPDKIIEEAVQFIDTNAKEPFFLYFASTIPHVALQIPDEELDLYPVEWDDKPYLGDKGYLPHPRPRAAYAAMITRFDSEVGELLAALKRNGITDNTIVIVTSDNGPSWVGGVDIAFFNSTLGLRGRKAQLFEGGIKVPTIVWWPNHIAPNSTDATPSAFWDWYPTLISLTGAEPVKTNGVSLTPLFEGEDLPERGLYWEHGKVQAFRKGDWKLIRKKNKNEIEVLLFNLRNDPNETTNVAKELPEKVVALTSEAMASRIVSNEFSSFLDKE